jgi:hypothetical protein
MLTTRGKLYAVLIASVIGAAVWCVVDVLNLR